MPRRRLHAPEAVLDAAEELLLETGRTGLTVRALAGRSGASNGSIYHAFGSVDVVVARAWHRRAVEFLAVQSAAAAPEPDAVRAVQAAADAPARFAERELAAARLLVSVRRDDLLTDALPADLAEDLRALDGRLVDLLRQLARGLWDRADPGAVDVVTTCVVRLPGALLFPDIRAGRVRELTRAQLSAAVAAVLGCGPP
ncbi:TetR/AcrR family transcriptional regulator [Blastococcus sp. SYSU D00669]